MYLREYACAKVNWALSITGARHINGAAYHELDMLMQRVTLCDTLEAESADELSLSVPGAEWLATGDNLILRAARLLAEETGCVRGASLRLTKRIPSQAGLGGGSSDAATALRMLCELWDVRVPRERMMELALSLGADVPFFVDEAPLKRVRGIGERLTPLESASKEPVYLVIAMPERGLSTRDVFARADELGPQAVCADINRAATALAARDWITLRRYAVNELLPAAESLLDEIPGMIERLYGLGARFASMSGSGSAVFGAFESESAADDARARLDAREAFVARAIFGLEAHDAQT